MSEVVSKTLPDSATTPNTPKRGRRFLRRLGWTVAILATALVVLRVAMFIALPTVLRGVAATYGLNAEYERSQLNLLSGDAELWSFNTKTEEVKQLASAPVGTNAYIASLDADPTGRYLYFNAGAHGGSDRDGTPLVQYDLKTGKRKVIAFLHPYFQEKYGLTMRGTYSTAVDPSGTFGTGGAQCTSQRPTPWPHRFATGRSRWARMVASITAAT